MDPALLCKTFKKCSDWYETGYKHTSHYTFKLIYRSGNLIGDTENLRHKKDTRYCTWNNFYFKKVILHGLMYTNVSTMCFSKIFFCQELNAKVNKVTA